MLGKTPEACYYILWGIKHGRKMIFKLTSFKNYIIWVLQFLNLTFVSPVFFYNLDLVFEFTCALK